jgi:hypothetical protein
MRNKFGIGVPMRQRSRFLEATQGDGNKGCGHPLHQ